VNRELKRSRPDRKRLECQCVSAVAFVKNEPELLDSPIWIMLINVVALEMLKAKMPAPGDGGRASRDNGGQGHVKGRWSMDRKMNTYVYIYIYIYIVC
jgi:hypothetical protein